jgi:hypothetical protein
MQTQRQIEEPQAEASDRRSILAAPLTSWGPVGVFGGRVGLEVVCHHRRVSAAPR